MQEVVPRSGVLAMDHASFLIIDRGEIGMEILLVEKNKQPGVWGLPGGQSQADENPIQTMWRETIKEIGVTVEDPSIVLQTTVEEPSPYVFVVFGKYIGYIDIKALYLGPEVKTATFFHKRQIDELIAAKLIHPRHANAIQEYERMRCF